LPEWLTSTFEADTELTLSLLGIRLLAALALGCIVAGIYRFTHGRPELRAIRAADANGRDGSSLMATLVLLTILIAMMTLVIGNNVARAFSLVGALAIVRFRTVVEDTRDTAFVIFAVCVGMAVGAGFLKVPLLGIPIAGAAAFLFRPRARDLDERARGFRLTVRLNLGLSPDAVLADALKTHVEWSHLVEIGTARQGAAIECEYDVSLRREYGAPALLAELHRLEGVQGVELSRK
jgi:uncharacterized membrane protein YhiD involved in acid resistance